MMHCVGAVESMQAILGTGDRPLEMKAGLNTSAPRTGCFGQVVGLIIMTLFAFLEQRDISYGLRAWKVAYW